MEYVSIKSCDINPHLFKHFVRHQIVTKCWRKIDNDWVIQNIPFVDDWSVKDYARILNRLQQICVANGVVIGAFENQQLKGLVAVKPDLFGAAREYLDLTDLYVSEEARGQGIGRNLFELAKEWAKEHGAKKLYLSTHSSVESQAFYRAMGCVEAKEYDPEHTRLEPCDCQLECEV